MSHCAHFTNSMHGFFLRVMGSNSPQTQHFSSSLMEQSSLEGSKSTVEFLFGGFDVDGPGLTHGCTMVFAPFIPSAFAMVFPFVLCFFFIFRTFLTCLYLFINIRFGNSFSSNNSAYVLSWFLCNSNIFYNITSSFFKEICAKFSEVQFGFITFGSIGIIMSLKGDLKLDGLRACSLTLQTSAHTS